MPYLRVRSGIARQAAHTYSSTTHHSPPLTTQPLTTHHHSHTPSLPTQIFTNRLTLSAHLRICTGGKWECEWCGCKETETPSKAGGPSGPKTLCNACGSRFRAGHTSMPKKDEEGR